MSSSFHDLWDKIWTFLCYVCDVVTLHDSASLFIFLHKSCKTQLLMILQRDPAVSCPSAFSYPVSFTSSHPCDSFKAWLAKVISSTSLCLFTPHSQLTVTLSTNLCLFTYCPIQQNYVNLPVLVLVDNCLSTFFNKREHIWMKSTYFIWKSSYGLRHNCNSLMFPALGNVDFLD